MKRLFLGIVILLLIFPTVSAYNATFNVSSTAMSLMTATATNTTRGLNVSVVKIGTFGTTLAVVSTAVSTIALGVTKVATVGIQQNCSNISTISRGAITFPVQLPSNATIINASLILYLSSKTVTFGTPDMWITSYSPSDMTNQIANDYKQFKDTDVFYNATPIQFATWTAATTKVIVLNDAARTAINSSNRINNEGNITFGLRVNWDVEANNQTMVWTPLTEQSALYTLAGKDAVDHRQDPKLNITYSLPDPLPTPTPCPTCAPGSGGCSLSPGNFSQVANFSGYGMIIFQNKTYDVYDQNYTPLPVYLLIAGIGLLFLIISFIVQKNAEIFAAIAIIPLAAASWSSLSIDMVQSFGLSALANVSMQSIWILLENHVVYPNVALAIIFLILTVVAFIQFIHELLQGRSIENTPEEPDEN